MDNTNTLVALSLTVSEINDILSVLGELPTKTGAWLLLTKIKEQADKDLKALVKD
jgi:hypothetical protein